MGVSGPSLLIESTDSMIYIYTIMYLQEYDYIDYSYIYYAQVYYLAMIGTVFMILVLTL